MTGHEIASIIIGVAPIGVVLYGISRIEKANDSGVRLQYELMERQERESIRRHTESMATLKDQGQALRRQGQAFGQTGYLLKNHEL